MKARVLPPEEWDRLGVTNLPPITPYVRPQDIEVVVVEDGDKIVASMAVMRLTHFEGAWIDPQYRGNAGLVRMLLHSATEEARAWTDNWVIAGAADDRMRDILARLGGVKIPMDTYALGLGR